MTSTSRALFLVEHGHIGKTTTVQYLSREKKWETLQRRKEYFTPYKDGMSRTACKLIFVECEFSPKHFRIYYVLVLNQRIVTDFEILIGIRGASTIVRGSIMSLLSGETMEWTTSNTALV